MPSVRNKTNPYFAKENHVKIAKFGASKELLFVELGNTLTTFTARMAEAGDPHWTEARTLTAAEAVGRYVIVASAMPAGYPVTQFFGNRSGSATSPWMTSPTGDYWTTFTSATVKTFSGQVTGGTTQYWRAARGTAAGTGGDLVFTTPVTSLAIPARAPVAPPAPTLSDEGSGTVAVTIAASTQANGSTIASYRIERATDLAFTTPVTVATVLVANIGTPTDATSLSGTVYFRTIAISNLGESLPSPVASITVGSAATVPATPTAANMVLVGGGSPTITLVGPFGDGGSPITQYEYQVTLATDTGFASPAVDAFTPSIGDPGDETVFDLPGLATGSYIARVRTRNAVGASSWSAATASVDVVEVGGVEIVASGENDVAFTIAEDDDGLAINITSIAPAAYVGEWSVSLSDMATDGYEVLTGPVIEPSEVIIGEEGADTFTGYGALIAYRADLYAATDPEIDFRTTVQWHRDGTPIGDPVDMAGAPVNYTPTDLGSYTLVETIPDLLGGTQTVTSPAIVARGAFELTAEELGTRWIDLGGIISDSRKMAVVALYDDVATSTGWLWTNGTHANNILNNVYFWMIASGGGPRGKFSDPANTYGGTPTSSGVVDATPRPLVAIQVGDLDRDASNRVTTARLVSPLDDKAVSAVSTATAPAVPVDLSEFAINRGALDGTGQAPAGMKLRFFWAASVFPVPDNNLGTVSAALRDAFFNIGGTAPNLTISPRPVRADGIVTVGGVDVVPEIFLRGPQLGQYDAGGGVKKLTNYGSGADPILNGDFFS